MPAEFTWRKGGSGRRAGGEGELAGPCVGWPWRGEGRGWDVAVITCSTGAAQGLSCQSAESLAVSYLR